MIFETFKAIKMSKVVFQVLTPCNVVEGYRHFGVTYDI